MEYADYYRKKAIDFVKRNSAVNLCVSRAAELADLSASAGQMRVDLIEDYLFRSYYQEAIDPVNGDKELIDEFTSRDFSINKKYASDDTVSSFEICWEEQP